MQNANNKWNVQLNAVESDCQLTMSNQTKNKMFIRFEASASRDNTHYRATKRKNFRRQSIPVLGPDLS